jgi:hypothetical protein
MGIKPDYQDEVYSRMIYVRPPEDPMGPDEEAATSAMVNTDSGSPIPRLDRKTPQECVGARGNAGTTNAPTYAPNAPTDAPSYARTGPEHLDAPTSAPTGRKMMKWLTWRRQAGLSIACKGD